MIFAWILLVIALLVVIGIYWRQNKKLSYKLLEKQEEMMEANRVDEAIWHNINAYLLLISDDFIVKQTNFYSLTNQVKPSTEKRVGEIFYCKNALDAGECGTHELCGACPIRAAIAKGFKERAGFSGVETTMTLYTSEDRTSSVSCDVQVAGAYLHISGKNEMLLTIYDITKQKEDQAKLLKAQLAAEESNRLKSAFLANMSHEIRTPLSAIIGFSPLLAAATTAEEKESYINIINKNGDLLLQLINDILDLSKIEAGTLEFIYSEIDINSIVNELEGIFRMRLSDMGSTVEVTSNCPLPVCVIHTERNRLAQVISNFLSNAIKFTTEGSIHLGYEVRDADIRFYVTDTGTGIPKDQLDKVFERFTKLNAKKQGTGLGLSISRMIVEKLGGEIGVESEEGKGSTFWFTLPVQPLENSFSNEVVIEQSLVMSEEVNRSVTSDEKKTLLVAEDMEDNFLLCEALLGKKYKLIHAWNGEEAISLFLKHNPAAILMDLRMPVVDGYQAAEAIRQISATVPIIAVTAFAFAEDKHRVMSSGFTDYLSKPIQADTLNEKLHSVGL